MIRKVLLSAFMAVAASMLACDETAPPSVAGVEGTYDIALAGDLLFVTATDQNELRVVNLTLSPPDWVRAPNPLHPLSIPVVDRPIGLVRDVSWGSGAEVGGNYVYARSANSREISVVDRFALREVAVITASATEDITALAARGAGEDQPSTLYVATWDGQRSVIRAVTLPPPAQLESDPAGACTGVENASRRCYPLAGPVVTTAACASVSSLLVMPQDTRLGIALRPSPDFETRCPGPATDLLRTASSFIFDAADGSFTPLQFGAPVRQLFTNPAFAEEPAGTRIFGVLDENRCSGDARARCRGVVAVVGSEELVAKQSMLPGACGKAVGQIACDVTGAPMLPINPGGPLVMGAAVGQGNILVPGFATPNPSRLLGVLTTSNGRLHFWDAENLREFDVAQTETGAEATARALYLQMLNPDGTPREVVGGPHPPSIKLAEGAVRDEQIFFSYRAFLPGFGRLPAPAAGVPVIDLDANPVGVVQVGDEVVVNAAEGCDGLVARTVTSVAAREGGGGTIVVDAPLDVPLNCSVGIRPSMTDPAPWVVFGTASGFLGRIAPSVDETDIRRLPADPGARASLYYHHPVGYDPLDPAPLIEFVFQDPFASGEWPDPRPVGLAYIVGTEANFQPASLSVDPRRYSSDPRLTNVAGSVVFRPGTDNILVAFPSGDVVLQIRTRILLANGVVSEFDSFR